MFAVVSIGVTSKKTHLILAGKVDRNTQRLRLDLEAVKRPREGLSMADRDVILKLPRIQRSAKGRPTAMMMMNDRCYTWIGVVDVV